MAVLNLLLNSGLIFLHTSDIFVRNISKLYDSIIPEHYNIKLVPYVNQNIFYGECNISINILHEEKHINFHSDVKGIISIMLTDNPPRFQKYDKEKIIVYKPTIYLYNNEAHISKFAFDNNLPSGRYILQIKFIGDIADNKGFRIVPSNENGNGTWIAATHFQTIGAQKMFPCWNKPTLRATFNISIKHHHNYIVFSNMAVREKKMIENNKVWTHFSTTPTMPIYLVAAVAIDRSKFVYLEGGENTIIWYRKSAIYGMSHAQNVIKNITLYLESEWKRPQLKVDHVVIPNFQDENMVNLGLVLYRESDILYYNKIDPIARKIEVAFLIGQKIVQEWFHNVFNTSWCSFELNEALIPFVGLYVVDQALPNSRMMDLFVVQFLQDYLHVDADPSLWPVTSRTNSSFEVPRCIKALIYLRMLQSSYPEKEFWENIRRYIYNNEPSYDVFRKILLSEDNISRHTKLFTMILDTINSWIKQKHYPVINAMRDYDNPELPINISIQNFNTSSDYYIPISMQEYYDSDIPFDILLKGPLPHKFPFKKDGWIILNKQQMGYYRVKYDSENWRKLSNYLDSKNYIKIHVLNRAQIIDDAFHLMIARQIDSSIFWNLTIYLSRETDYVAWYPMFKALEYMSRVFPLPKKEVDDIKVKMRKILNTLLEKLQYKEISNNEHDLNKCLRQEAAKWACIFDDSKCKTEANNKLNQHLAKPETYELLPWWKEWTYCNGLAAPGAELTWLKVYNMSIKGSDNKILKFLACSRNPNIIIKYLELIEITFMESNFHPKDYLDLQTEKHYINSFFFTITKHAKNNEILIFLLTNLEKIKLRQIYTIATLTIVINSVYSKEQLDEISKFLDDSLIKIEQVDAGTISLKNEEYKFLEKIVQHILKIRNKIKVRQSEIEMQIKHLESFRPIRK